MRNWYPYCQMETHASKFVLSFLLILLLVGCASSPTESVQGSQSTSLQDWHSVQMVYSGGPDDLERSIVIVRDGKTTITDHRENKTVTKQLSWIKLFQLTDLIESAYYEPHSEPPCLICFVYIVDVYLSDDKLISWGATSFGLSESGLEPLANFLLDLMEKGLK